MPKIDCRWVLQVFLSCVVSGRPTGYTRTWMSQKISLISLQKVCPWWMKGSKNSFNSWIKLDGIFIKWIWGSPRKSPLTNVLFNAEMAMIKTPCFRARTRAALVMHEMGTSGQNRHASWAIRQWSKQNYECLEVEGSVLCCNNHILFVKGLTMQIICRLSDRISSY